MQSIIEGIAEGCRQSDCALIGGEMAEMNDMYQKGDFDLAGFCVGVVKAKGNRWIKNRSRRLCLCTSFIRGAQ